ncbi:xanthine/CO dehydrogenase XdhC/CoxF family maturation factor [Erwinia persicina]|uniref:XdhC family protein n=2 Tax=Erwinia TaxID=551 RepID=A0ABV4E8J7_9GAMM|nr:XdhC family protein [Erwinia persicina]MCP1440522.1 xanthine/CO dehydrogenase XdhC/CoxF family maturation factor [Erwinia persicina]
MRQALSWTKDRPVWLCIVIKTWGSSPWAVGSLPIVDGGGAVCAGRAGDRQQNASRNSAGAA